MLEFGVKSYKTAVVTGANGQDGSYLVEHLLDEGYRVIGIVRRSSTDNKDRIKHLLDNEKFELVQGDVTDSSNVNSWIREFRPDEFYNLAAQSHVGTSFSQPQLTWRVNAEGVINILEAIKNISPNVKLYQASTSEMFGRNYTTESNADKFQDEKTPFAPQSPYGVAKVAAHQSVQMYREAYNTFGCCGILFNHESPRRGEQFVTRKITKWLGEYSRWYLDIMESRAYGGRSFKGKLSLEDPDFISLHNNKFPKLRLGNLSAYRDWGHAKDYVKAMHMMMQLEKPSDYVICTGKTYSVQDFLTAAFNAAGISKNSEDFIVQDKIYMRPAEVDFLKGSNKRARHLLGWKPEYDFNSLVKEMVKEDMRNG